MGELDEGRRDRLRARGRGVARPSASAGRSTRRPAPAAADAGTPGALTPAQIAWIALVPCTIAAALAILLLGPPLGHALFKPGSDPLWPPGWWETEGHPEPVKQARFLLAVLAAFLLAVVVVVGSRRRLELRPVVVQAATLASYGLVLALLAVAMTHQVYAIEPRQSAPAVFGPVTVAVAAALVLAALLALRRPAVLARVAELARETTARRVVGVAIVLAFSAIWLLKVLLTDRLTGDIGGLNLLYTLNDAFAVLDGRTPLVDYHIIYAKLLPYPAALALATFGATTLTYTGLMAVLDGLVLFAVYSVFRRVTRSSLLAVGLFLPFVATGDVNTFNIGAGLISSPMTLSAMWPMRYGGAYLLAWLASRNIDGAAPRRTWALFLVGGLVAIDNQDFGVAAVAATVVALLCARPPRSRAAALRLAGEAAGGVLGAVALVCLLTLVRAGTLPHPALLSEWPRIFTTLGWFSLPLHTMGLHLAVYATFVAAIALAAVRFARVREDVLLTSMLAWSGTFGVLAGGYFIGRPDAFKIDGILSAWCFSLVMLTIVCVRALTARGWRRPQLPELLVLFGFGLSICLVARLSPPQQQLSRLVHPLVPPQHYRADADRFVGEHTQPGEAVAILVPMGSWIAHDLELDNVSPYGVMNEIVTRSQLRTLIDVARREHVSEIFTPEPRSLLLWEGDSAPQQLQALAAAGYRLRSKQEGILELRRS
jgi:hypothetical protein